MEKALMSTPKALVYCTDNGDTSFYFYDPTVEHALRSELTMSNQLKGEEDITFDGYPNPVTLSRTKYRVPIGYEEFSKKWIVWSPSMVGESEWVEVEGYLTPFLQADTKEELITKIKEYTNRSTLVVGYRYTEHDVYTQLFPAKVQESKEHPGVVFIPKFLCKCDIHVLLAPRMAEWDKEANLPVRTLLDEDRARLVSYLEQHHIDITSFW